MSKIRVLIVDDAVVVRKMVADVISSDPDIEVVGTAANGRIAMSKLPQVNPDIVTLDVEMPEMNGLETLLALRKQYPTLPVIMFSTLTQRGAETTIDALTRGANDYVTKPANVGSVKEAVQSLREQLIPKLKLWCRKTSHAGTRPSPVSTATSPPPAPRPASTLMSPVDIVAIGVSTGGPNALSKVVSDLKKDFPVPIVIVQHMPPIFTKLLAERLDTVTPLKVCEAQMGMSVEPGNIYIAPGQHHMVLKRELSGVKILTNQEPPENSCRPAVDVLFRSVAEVYRSGTLGVVLTGMGQDGLRGSERIREAGGQILAQDEATSVVWGMPGFVARSGLANQILPLNDVAGEILRRARRGRIENHTQKGICV